MGEPWLREAQDDATMLSIRAQEAAGLDIITDGEIRRESYSNRFATALEGVDVDNPGTAGDGGRGADAAFGAWYPVSAPPEGVASRQAYVQPGPARPTPRETR